MMKLFATLSILGFVAAKSVRIDEVEFGFCGKLEKDIMLLGHYSYVKNSLRWISHTRFF